MNTTDIKDVVREKYGQAARRVKSGGSSCCGASGATTSCCDPITSNLYSPDEAGALPEQAVLASLGCGNPTALIDLQEGQTVLDLGSGGGIDVLLSAKRVGPSGFAYGLDRVVMLAAGEETIREVIAFPKNQQAEEPMTGAPAPAEPHQLRDLGLQPIRKPPAIG